MSECNGIKACWRRKKIGEMLVNAGVLDREAVDKALVEAAKQKTKLGQYLVSAGLVSEEQLISTLSKQLGIDVYNPRIHKADPTLESVVSYEMASANTLVPLQRNGSLLYVAILDQTNLDALDAVTEVSRLDVEPLLCREHEFDGLAKLVYGRSLISGAAAFNLDEELGEGHIDATQLQPEAVSVHTLQSLAEDAPVIRMVDAILATAVQRGASDIHLCPQDQDIQLRYRVDGVLQQVSAPHKQYYLALVSRMKILAGMDISQARIPQDGRFTVRYGAQEVSLRVSTIPTIYGEKVVLRLLQHQSRLLQLDELGLSEFGRQVLEAALGKSYGMILASGPTGSGKSTLLHTLLQRLNTQEVNIVTLEDPVEMRIPGVAQIQLNPKAGMTFASGLRAILRQDPDIIMVGEIRDGETADIAVKSALTGHRLLSTLHTNDAAGAVTRLSEMGVEPFLIASTLLVVVAQRLLRRVCPECREYHVPTPEMLRMLGSPASEVRLVRGKGCAACGQTGYRGRIGIYEVLPINPTIRDMILKGMDASEIKKTALERRYMRTLAMDAATKTLNGMTSFDEFMRLGTF